MKLWLIILATAYLLGSIPFGYLLVLVFKKEDVRDTGSGNIGATNVARSGGKTLGILTLVLDALKGVIAVLIARHFAPSATFADLVVWAAVAAVIGHVFPIWLGFKGGKGIATALGVFLALVPLVALSALGLFLIIAFTTRYVSLASIAAAASIPLFAWLEVPARTPVLMIGLSVISLLSIVKHHANITRLMRGTESKFGTKKKEAQA